MSRRVYTPTPQRKKLQQEALLHLRAARKAIDPALLERARELILKSSPALEKETPPPASEPVDRAKTLNLVREYMLLKRDNKDVCNEIRTLLIKKP